MVDVLRRSLFFLLRMSAGATLTGHPQNRRFTPPVCVNVHARAHTHAYVCMHARTLPTSRTEGLPCVNVYVHARACTHTHTYAHMHACSHTPTSRTEGLSHIPLAHPSTFIVLCQLQRLLQRIGIGTMYVHKMSLNLYPHVCPLDVTEYVYMAAFYPYVCPLDVP